MKKKRVVCLTGPSGVGKTSYAKRLSSELNFGIPEIVTTRAKRDDDSLGYHYVDDEQFNYMVSENLFLEHDRYLSYRYGTLRKSVSEILANDNFLGVALDLTPSGCIQIQEVLNDAVVIAIVPDDREWLRQRLFERNVQDPKEIESRSKILAGYLEQVASLSCITVVSCYSPETWDSTFKRIVGIVNSEQHG